MNRNNILKIWIAVAAITSAVVGVHVEMQDKVANIPQSMSICLVINGGIIITPCHLSFLTKKILSISIINRTYKDSS